MSLSNDDLVCRGGLCTAARFRAGSGVSIRADGTLDGISVNAGPGEALASLARLIPNREICVTTVGAIRAVGGDVRLAPTSRNTLHCVMFGLTAEQAESLFTPTLPNPGLHG